jgi:hypothetical protein
MNFFVDFWKKNKSNFLLISFGLIAFIFLLWIVSKNQNERISLLKEDHLFTMGTIRDFTYQKSHIIAKYTYIYLDSVYVGSKSISKFQKENSHQIGQKFLVIFSPQNSEINYLLPAYVNSEEWNEDGWKTPPNNYTTEKAFKYLDSNF